MSEPTETNKKSRFSLRGTFKSQIESLQTSGKSLVVTIILTFIIMVAACLTVFFMSLRGEERVMVPNVVGKNLTTALLEMQAKELYAKIQLKYSDEPGQEGTILSQEPSPGAIVKAYRRVTLTVSRGVAMESVEDYVGKNIDEVNKRLEALFSGQKTMVRIADKVYRQSTEPEGTIISQYPAPGASIMDPVDMVLVISSGDKIETVEVPDLAGKSLSDVLKEMAQSKVVFDFTLSDSTSEKDFEATLNSDAGTQVESYSRIDATVAFGEAKDDVVRGLFSYELPDYPFPVRIVLEAGDTDGKKNEIIAFNHPGKTLTIPYEVKKGTVLSLYVMGELTYELTAN